MCAAPTPISAAVITQRSGAPIAASALIVSLTELKWSGRSAAASVQPPISSTGAAADVTTPQPGTDLMAGLYAADSLEPGGQAIRRGPRPRVHRVHGEPMRGLVAM